MVIFSYKILLFFNIVIIHLNFLFVPHFHCTLFLSVSQILSLNNVSSVFGVDYE